MDVLISLDLRQDKRSLLELSKHSNFSMWDEIKMMMRSLLLSMAVALIAVVPASGDDVPFAAPSPPGELSSSSLADLMSLVQMRHIKIAFAGRAQNWDLVRFEAAQMQKGLTKAALQYVGIPVEFIIQAAKPLDDIREAAAAKDRPKLKAWNPSLDSLPGSGNL